MAEYHTYDVSLAKKYGIAEAVVLQNIIFWIEHNRANEKHFHDGRYWTFNSMKAFEELFPEFSRDQMRRILDKLRKSGVLLTGNYNTVAYDRTLWYALSDEFLGEFPQFHLAKVPNRIDESAKPIPYINTDINNNTVNTVAANTKREEEKAAEAKGTEPEEKEPSYSAEAREAFTYWEKRVGLLNPTLVENIADLVEEVGLLAFKGGVQKANLASTRSFFYVQAAARGIASGNDFDDKVKPQQTSYEDSMAELMEELKRRDEEDARNRQKQHNGDDSGTA